jgi:uncharacterized protein YjbI with pentapeptide repeats
MISSKYATDFLDNKQDYIPIPVLLGLTNEEGDFITAYEKNRLNLSLDNVLKNIIAVSEEISSNRILLILDGLDEYGDRNTISVGGKLRKLLDSSNHKYQNIKVLITSRLEDEILTKQHVSSIRKYVRLLSFEPTQINYFFERYGVKVGDRLLNKEYALKLKLPVEEMSKPLFAWIFSFLQVYGDAKTQLKIESKSHWTPNMVKSWMYLLFFHQTISGKYRNTLDFSSQIKSYFNEKKILRIIAALKWIYGKDLTWRRAESKIDSFTDMTTAATITNTTNTSSTIDLQSVSKTSYFFYLQTIQSGKLVEFVHRTFLEYLLAEYYIDILLQNGDDNSFIAKRLNIGTPSEPTILFLDGLLDLILEARKEGIQEHIYEGDFGLLKSLDYKEDPEDAIEKLKTNCLKCLEQENIVFLSTKDDRNGDTEQQQKQHGRISHPQESRSIWREVVVTNEDYCNFWIHRWIALYVYNKINRSDRKPNPQRISSLIKFSSNNLIPPYLKNLKRIDLLPSSDLRGANLEGADLRGANLEGADLRGANLEGADLRGANLVRANLVRANLSVANLVRANLVRANLSVANLVRANLVRANLEGADLEGADLRGSYLNVANLVRANLGGADLRGTFLTEANLEGADLRGANLVRANLGGADLRGTFLTEANLRGANLVRADLEGAYITDANLVRADLRETVNLPLSQDQAKAMGALI